MLLKVPLTKNTVNNVTHTVKYVQDIVINNVLNVKMV